MNRNNSARARPQGKDEFKKTDGVKGSRVTKAAGTKARSKKSGSFVPKPSSFFQAPSLSGAQLVAARKAERDNKTSAKEETVPIIMDESRRLFNYKNLHKVFADHIQPRRKEDVEKGVQGKALKSTLWGKELHLLIRRLAKVVKGSDSRASELVEAAIITRVKSLPENFKLPETGFNPYMTCTDLKVAIKAAEELEEEHQRIQEGKTPAQKERDAARFREFALKVQQEEIENGKKANHGMRTAPEVHLDVLGDALPKITDQESAKESKSSHAKEEPPATFFTATLGLHVKRD